MQSSLRKLDQNGFFRVDRNPLSKTGVFDYLGSELPGAPDPAKVYRVLRPPEELGSPETIASFSLVPVVDEHTWIGPGGTPVDNKPVYGVSGEGVEFDGTYLTAPLKIFNLPPDPKAELSCGYACEYDWTPGTWNGEPYDAVQRNIRGNHVALVWEGRMGPEVRVLDHLPTIAFDSLEYVKMADAPDNTAAVEALTQQVGELMPLIDMVKALEAKLGAATDPAAAEAAANEAEEVAGEVVEAASEVEQAAAAVEAEPEEGEEAAMAMLDEKEKALDSAVRKLKPHAKSLPAQSRAGDAKLRAANARTNRKLARVGDSAVAGVAARDALAARLFPHVGVFDHKAMSLSQVQKYGREKLELSDSIALDSFLAGREHAGATQAADSTPQPTGAFADWAKTNQERT